MMGKKSTEVKISTLIGQGCELSGDFTAKGSARIDGIIEGNVTVEGNLLIGAGGSITGNVTAASVLIGGTVIGDVIAPEKAELTATGKVLGDITTKAIVIDENAIFQGKMDMNQSVPARKNKSTATRAVRTGRKTAKAAIAEALKEVQEQESREAMEETATPMVNVVAVEPQDDSE